MSGYQYLKDKRFNSVEVEKKTRINNITKIILLILSAGLVFTLAITGFKFYLANNIDKIYDEFETSCKSKNYSEALTIYRKLQENILTKQLFDSNNEKRKNIILKMEKYVDNLLLAPFINLTEKNVSLTQTNLELIDNFQELSNRKYTDLLTTHLEQFLLGKYKKDSVIRTLNEISKVKSLKEIALRYLKEVDDMNKFSPKMIEINKDLINKNYLVAALKIKNELKSQSGFIKTYLNKTNIFCKKEMYSPVLIDIDVMMSSGKFYTAKSTIDRALEIFENDVKLISSLKICESKTTKKLIEYFKPVDHLSFRPLIANTSLAFDNDNYAKNANDLMVTTYEFRKILDELYKNNYLLIDMDSLVDSFGKKNRLFVPEGKIPVILSIEGLNYYAGRSRSGNCENLVLDKNGFVASSYINSSGVKVVGRNGEIIGILEQFIESHPDFSFDGAKGTISLTGYECIFGYVVNSDQVDDRTKAFADNQLEPFNITNDEIENNKKAVINIIKKLKSSGWTFASSSYGGISFSTSSIDQIKNDTNKFKSQVESLTGKVKSLFFPNGNFVTSKDPKGIYLINSGFYIQCGIGPTAYFSYSDNHLYMDRVTVNGIAFKYVNLSRFFDVLQIYDPARKVLLK